MNNPAKDPAVRLSGLGGSDASPAMGVSKWMSPLDLYLTKLGFGEQREESAAMEIGSDIEHWVLGRYARKSGLRVCGRLPDGDLVTFQPDGSITPVLSQAAHWLDTLRSPVDSWRFCHLDGIAYPPDGEGVDPIELLEGKSALSRYALYGGEWGEDDTDQVPADYICQAHHNATVFAEATLLDLPVIIPAILAGPRWGQYRVVRDPEFVEIMLDLERDMWRRIQEEDPPMPVPTEAGMRALTRLYPAHAGEDRVVTPTEGLHWTALDLAQAMEEEKAKHEEVIALKEVLMTAMGQTPRLLGDGWKATWKQTKDTTTVDWQAVARSLTKSEKRLNAAIRKHTTTKPGSRPFRFTPAKKKED